MAKPSDIVVEARERFKLSAEAEEPQRKAMLEAKKFRGGDQWPDAIKIQRAGGQGLQGQAAQPPRPCLTIDRLSQPVRQVSNSVRAANFAIDVLPNGHGADDATADIYKGIIRRIQNQARGEAPIDWAADGAAECGIGWFRIRTDYIPLPPGAVGPEVKDQDIHLERITNNLTVYDDPTAKKPTRSDARWRLVTEDLAKSEGQRKYDLSDADMASLDEFMATGDESNNGWVTKETFRVAEYWRVVDEEETIVQTESGDFLPLPEGQKASDFPWSRVVTRPRVKMSLINAVKELKKTEWAGSKIPLIPILGEELNIDGKTRLRGIIEPGMDPQRMVNFMYSGAIETVALAPRSPFIVAEGQIDDPGYKKIWQTANVANYSYLPYKPTSLNGTPIGPPQRDNAEPAIQAMVLMLAKSEEAIKATTGFHDPSLGTDNPREKSGKAILALQKQAELGASNYLDNVQRALVYAGELLVELIPRIYDRPGRVLQILGIDDQPQQVIVGQAFDPQKQGPPKPASWSKDQVRDPNFDTGLAQFYDLMEGQYSVTVSVSKSHTTRREEGANKLGEIIAARPDLIQIIGDLWARDLDIPGAQEMAERLHKMLPPPLQQQEGADQVPPQVQAQMAKAQEMIQMLTQELNAKNQIIETDQIKTQGQIQVKQIQEQAESQRVALQTESDRQIQMAKLQIEMRKIEAQIEIEMAKLGSAQMMKRGELETDLLHAHNERQLRVQEAGAQEAQANLDRMAGMQGDREQRSADAAESERGRQHEQAEGEAQRAHEADQASLQRLTDLAVQPENGNGGE